MEPRRGEKYRTGFHWETNLKHETPAKIDFRSAHFPPLSVGFQDFLVKYFSVFEEKRLNFRWTNIGGVKSPILTSFLEFWLCISKNDKIGMLLLTELS